MTGEPTPRAQQQQHRINRRRAPRPGVAVTFRPGSLGLGPNLALAVVDLSEDGVCVRLKSAVKAGITGELTMAPTGKQRPSKMEAEVRWCREEEGGTFLVGLQLRRRMLFRDLSELAQGFASA